MNSKYFWYAFPKNKQNNGRCVSLAPWNIIWNLVGWSNCINFELRFSSTLADVAFLRRKTLSTHAHTQSSQEGSNMHRYHIGMKKWILNQIYIYIHMQLYIYIFRYIYIYKIKYTYMNKYTYIYIYTYKISTCPNCTHPSYFLWGVFFFRVSSSIFTQHWSRFHSVFSSLGPVGRWVKDLFFFWGGEFMGQVDFV